MKQTFFISDLFFIL